MIQVMKKMTLMGLIAGALAMSAAPQAHAKYDNCSTSAGQLETVGFSCYAYTVVYFFQRYTNYSCTNDFNHNLRVNLSSTSGTCTSTTVGPTSPAP